MSKAELPKQARTLLKRAGKRRTTKAIETANQPTIPCSSNLAVMYSDDPDLLKARISALALVGLGPKSVSRKLQVSEMSAAKQLNLAIRDAGELTPAKLAILTSRMFSVLVVSSTLATGEYISRVISLQLAVERIEKEPLNSLESGTKEAKDKRIKALREEIDAAFSTLGRFSSNLTGSLSAMGVPRIAKEIGNDTHTPSSTADNFYNSLVGKGDIVDELVAMSRRQYRKAMELKKKQVGADVGLINAEIVESGAGLSDGGSDLDDVSRETDDSTP